MEQGLSIELLCSVTGLDNRVDDIEWFRDGSKLETSYSRGVLIEHHYSAVARTYASNLIVRRVGLADSGTYVCRVTDQISQPLKVYIKTNEDRRIGKLFIM